MRGQVASFPLGEKGIGHLTLNCGRLRKRFPMGGRKTGCLFWKTPRTWDKCSSRAFRTGKSTLDRILAGVDYYSSGEVVDRNA